MGIAGGGANFTTTFDGYVGIFELFVVIVGGWKNKVIPPQCPFRTGCELKLTGEVCCGTTIVLFD